MLWAVLRAIEIVDKDPEFVRMDREDLQEVKETLLGIKPRPSTGWVIIRDLNAKRAKIIIRLFTVLAQRAEDLFSDITLAGKMRTYALMVRRRFYELYLRKYLGEQDVS